MKQKLMSFDEWVEEYKPIKNTIDSNASYDGLMHETYGKEEEFVRKADDAKIWTLIDTDGENQIDNGYARVNRMGYFITEKPAPEGQFISVVDDPKSYLRQMRKDGYIRDDNPHQTFELSPEMETAWNDIKKRFRKPK